MQKTSESAVDRNDSLHQNSSWKFVDNHRPLALKPFSDESARPHTDQAVSSSHIEYSDVRDGHETAYHPT